MRIWTPVLVCGALVLAGCGDRVRNSALNPGNWFGAARSAPVAVETDPEITNPLIPSRRSVFARSEGAYAGTAVSDVTDLRVERRPGGALIVATGQTNSVGYFDVKLVPEETQVGGVLTYTLRAVKPETVTPSSSPAARQVVAAEVLTDQDLQGVRRIVVRAQNNERSVRR